MTLKVENRTLAVPGDLLAEGDYLLGEGTYSQDGKVFAEILGLVDNKENFIKIIPLSGKYVPRPRDLVIGVVTDVAFSSWYVDINSPYSGVLNVANATERFINLDEEDLTKIFDIGDVILAKVANVSQSMMVGMTMKDRGLFKLNEGRLITISPTKVPRVIGKKGTMVNLLKDYTGCKLTVGQNGRVWISGGNVNLAIRAIRLIEELAHTSGLTDKIREFLEKEAPKPAVLTPKPVEEKPAPAAEAQPAPAPAKSEPKPVEEKPAPAEEKPIAPIEPKPIDAQEPIEEAE